MNIGWQSIPLGEACPISSRKVAEFAGKRRYFSTGAVGPEGELLEPDSVTFATRPSRAGCMPKIGDIGFARMKGTMKVVLIDDTLNGSLFSTGFCFVAPRPNIDPRFVFYFFTTSAFQGMKNDAAGKGIMGGIQNGEAAAIKVPVPSLSEQLRIVGVLDQALAGVAVARVNAERNLENARAIFDSALSGASGDKASLGDLVTVKTGKLDANAAVENGQYPFFTCAREIYAINSYAFDCNAILLAGNNAVGDFNVKHYHGKFNAYQRTYVITVQNEGRLLHRFLYYQMLKSLKRFKEQSVGAGTKFLKLGMIKDLEISLPAIAEQARIASFLDALLKESQSLESRGCPR